MKRTILFLFFFLPLGLFGQTAKDWGTEHWRVTLRGNYWSSDYSGIVKAVEEEDGKLIGETVDFVDDLDINTPSSVWEIELWARPSKRNRLILSYYQCRYRGDVDILPEELDFAGEEFTVDVKTYLVADRFSFYYQFLPFASERGGIGPLIGVEYFDLGVELKSEKIDQSAKETISIPIPVIGLAGDYVIGYGVGIWGKIGWIGLEIQDVMASYTDLEIGFSFKWKYLFAGVGYRYLESRLETGEEDEDGYLKVSNHQSGFLVSLGVNF